MGVRLYVGRAYGRAVGPRQWGHRRVLPGGSGARGLDLIPHGTSMSGVRPRDRDTRGVPVVTGILARPILP